MRTSLILLVLVLNAGISLAQNVHPHSLQIDRKNKTTFFIENKGQWDSEVLYLARLNGMSAWITKSGVVYDYYKIETDARHLQDIEQIKKSDRPESLIKGHVVRMDYGKELLNKEISFSGINKQSSYFNYFIGNDPAKWSSYVGLYDKAIVRNVFDGIDARYYFDNNSTSGVGNDNPIQCFRYDFIVNPGSDPTQIKMDFRGQDGIYIGENQELVIKTSIGEIKNAKIYAYQEKNEIIQQVECYFHQNPDGSISFSIGNYDKTMVLIIDPLVYSTFIGGSGDDEGYSIQSDAQGYTYITGATISKNYPTTIGAYDARGNDNKNAIISKLNPQGTDLIFSTYIGGSNYEEAYKIAIDSSGYSYITGNTMSSDFPTTYSVYDRDFNGGDTWGDVFLSKIDSSGSWLVYSTFLGGNGNDIGYNVSVDQSGFAFLTGKTESTDFPVTNGKHHVENTDYDIYVAKFNENATNLIYSILITDESDVTYFDSKHDKDGNVFIGASTYSVNYPVTSGAYNESINGKEDAVTTKVNPDGTNLVYSTFIGGNNADNSYGITIDQDGSAIITGNTSSDNYPTTPGVYKNFLSGTDIFVTKINPNGSALKYSTFFGGNGADIGRDVEIDNYGNVIITGMMNSSDFPVTDSLQTNSAISNEVFLTILDSTLSKLFYSTYFGGINGDISLGLSSDSAGNIYMTGSGSKGFPTTAGSYSTNLNGMYDVFVMKFSFPDFYPKVYLQVGDVEGKPGDEVVVPIYLINGDGLKNLGITNIDVDLTFNSTLLAPIEENITNIQNGRSILPLILPVTPDTNNIVARIRMKVGLGNDSTTVMKLENVVTIGASSQINTIDGKFTLLGICHEGGARLINSNSHSNIMSVSPNPAESSITLDFSLSESGYTEIGIYNIFGEKVKTLFSENVSDYNNRHLECNIAGLGSGQYMIIFQTPNYQQSTKLIILE